MKCEQKMIEENKSLSDEIKIINPAIKTSRGHAGGLTIDTDKTHNTMWKLKKMLFGVQRPSDYEMNERIASGRYKLMINFYKIRESVGKILKRMGNILNTLKIDEQKEVRDIIKEEVCILHDEIKLINRGGGIGSIYTPMIDVDKIQATFGRIKERIMNTDILPNVRCELYLIISEEVGGDLG